jgi:hypothetical protein
VEEAVRLPRTWAMEEVAPLVKWVALYKCAPGSRGFVADMSIAEFVLELRG